MVELDYGLLGQRIRAQRRKRGLTQEQLAEKIDRAATFVGHIERGTRIMSMGTFCRIALALECSTDELLGLEARKENRICRARELLALAEHLADELVE